MTANYVFNRFERARIIGARALQISMGAPIVLVDLATGLDPVFIAEAEFKAGVIPITVSETRAARKPRARTTAAPAA